MPEKVFHCSETNATYTVTFGDYGVSIVSEQLVFAPSHIPADVIQSMKKNHTFGGTMDLQGRRWNWHRGDDLTTITCERQLSKYTFSLPHQVWDGFTT